jgi:hypothetical protein
MPDSSSSPIRLRATNLELMRLDELLGKFRAKALEGCPISANLLIRLSERRSALLGLDHRQVDPVMLSLSVNQPESGTEKIMRALDSLGLPRGPNMPPPS